MWCKASDPGCRRKRSNLVARLVPFLSLGYARLSPRERHAPHATVAEKRINTPALSVWGVYAVGNAAKIRERDQRICGGDMEGGPGNPSFKDVSFMSIWMSTWVWHGSLVVCGSHGGSEELLTGEGDGL